MFIENLVAVCLGLGILGVISYLIHQMYQSQQKRLMEFMGQMNREFQLERERLLNRAMSRDWQTYMQLSQGMKVSHSGSIENEYVGMSDEEELRRAGYDVNGLGEALNQDDFDIELPSEESLLGDFDLQELMGE